MSEITNYKCPSCTGPLRFDAATGKLVCDYCESTFELEEIKALYKEETGEDNKEPGSESAEEAAGEPEPESGEENRSVESDTKADDSVWGEAADSMKVYNCPSCGAELICDETTAATFCPYCGNNTIIPGRLGGETLKPDLIIPFKYEKEQAIEALKNHYKGKVFLPKLFKDKNHIEKIRGIYVPFWLFDGTAEAEVDFAATRSHIIPGKKADVAVTEHFDVHRSGSISFEKIPTDAASKMPDDMMDSIEPFNYGEFEPFSTAYLPGFLADKYDVTVDESTVRADRRAEKTVVDHLRKTVHGYETCSVTASNVKIKHGKVSYALLPVWMLNTKWEGKDYMFAMNGQTGKMVGDLPVCKKRVAAMFFGISLPLMAIIGAIAFLLM